MSQVQLHLSDVRAVGSDVSLEVTGIARAAASISECGRYRYGLTRLVQAVPARICVFVMLNPSVADAMIDDATIRRCRAYARSFGCGVLHVVNFFAWRATDPKELRRVVRAEGLGVAVGPENDAHIARAIAAADVVLCAWGNHVLHRELLPRRAQMHAWLAGREVFCLGTTKEREPVHPLRQPKDAQLVPFRLEARP